MFALAKESQITDLFRKYNPSASASQVESFKSMVPIDSLSSFEVESFLAKFMGNARQAIDHVDDLLEDASVQDSRSLLERSMKRAHGKNCYIIIFGNEIFCFNHFFFLF